MTESEPTKEKEDLRARDEPISLASPQLPKAPVLSALQSPMPFNKKGKLDEMLELFKQVQIPLLDAIE